MDVCKNNLQKHSLFNKNYRATKKLHPYYNIKTSKNDNLNIIAKFSISKELKKIINFYELYKLLESYNNQILPKKY